ncbi:MAG: hypothetical protein AAB089_03335 [Nitrospirota bacterium]
MRLKKFNKLVIIATISFFSLLTCDNLCAQDTPTLTAPVQKKIVRDYVNLFYVMQYSPTVVVKVSDSSTEKYKNVVKPEHAAIVYLSAQAQGQFDRFNSVLSKSMQDQMAAELTKTGKTVTDLVTEWKTKYVNTKVELTHRVERGSYSIIRYRITSTLDGRLIEEKDIAIGPSSDHGRIYEVIDLRGDPVYENWNFEGTTKVIPKQ